jgi:DNA polymerase-3 subunit gamma/tau
MAQALYRKWRPQTFDEVVGQEHVTTTLRNALASGWIGHAYLFAGLRGTGKTTMARLVAKGVNCLAEDAARRPCNECAVCRAVNEGRFLDLIEIDAASHTGVDDVRELRDKVGFRPNEGRYKVYIIDEVHRFSGSAFDALLKTIEEPPEHAIFILATTEIHKVPATILSRCQRFDFRRIPHQQIVQRLQALAQAEGIQVESEALGAIARAATGSLRDAESLLDQLAAANLEGITVAQVQDTLGTIDVQLVTALVASLVNRDVAHGLEAVDKALSQGADLRQFTRQIIDYLRSMLLIQLQGASLLDLGDTALEAVKGHAQQIATPALVQTIKRFSEAEANLKGGWQPQLPLELALVETILEIGAGRHESPAETTPAGGAGEAPTVWPEEVSSPRLAPDPPPSAEPAEAPDAGVDEELDALSLGRVRHAWSRILEGVRARDRSVQALLNSTRPLDVQDETVTLQVAHEFARNKLSEARIKRLVEEVVSAVLDHRCSVAYILADPTFEGSATTGDSVGDQAAGDLLPDDPLVRAAREMGGEVRSINEGSES